MDQDEYFGDLAKVELMRRSGALYSLVKDDPRFAYYGRLVALSAPGDDTFELMTALAQLQGAGVCYYYPKNAAGELYAKLETIGLKTDRHEHYRGGERAMHASRQVLAENELPTDLTIRRLDKESPSSLVQDVAQLLQSCDVMPVPGSFLRGDARPGITIVAIDSSGNPVASASSFVIHHADNPHRADVFWGMLATRPDRRGQRIAVQLGAMAIKHMWENEAARGFITGVRRDNQSSQALCNRLGVHDTNWIYATCLNELVLGSSSVTR